MCRAISHALSAWPGRLLPAGLPRKTMVSSAAHLARLRRECLTCPIQRIDLHANCWPTTLEYLYRYDSPSRLVPNFATCSLIFVRHPRCFTRPQQPILRMYLFNARPLFLKTVLILLREIESDASEISGYMTCAFRRGNPSKWVRRLGFQFSTRKLVISRKCSGASSITVIVPLFQSCLTKTYLVLRDRALWSLGSSTLRTLRPIRI